MTLNKQICKKCKVHPPEQYSTGREDWIKEDNKFWNNDAPIYCMEGEDEWKKKLVTEVPPGCPYLLEHTVIKGEMK